MNRKILRIALPSIAQNVTIPLLGLADAAISGHLGGAAYIGAVAVGAMVFNMLYWLCGFLRMSTGGLTAQACGRTSAEDASLLTVLLRAMRIGGGIALLFVVLQGPLGYVAFRLMDATPEVEALARTYFKILIWGAPAVLGGYALSGWFLGRQDARTPMRVAIVQNVLNIALSLFFVVNLGWKVEGVAAGTLIAQWAGLAMFLLTRVSLSSSAGAQESSMRKPLMSFVWQAWRGRGAQATQRIQTNSWSVELAFFLRTLCMVIVQVWFTRSGASQGDTMLAVNALLMQFYLLFSYVMDGFAYAGEALGGKFYGAADRPSFLSLTRWLYAWGAALTLAFSFVYFFFGTPLLTLLTDDLSVVRAATAYLPYACILPLCGVAAFLFDGLCIGTTSSRLMLLSVGVGALAFFAVQYSASLLFAPNDALWLAMLAFLTVRGLVLAFCYRRLLP